MIDKLHKIVTDIRTERAITALIIFNAIILGLETSPRAMQAFGPALEALDEAILGVFVIEILARIVVFRLRFFRDPWSIFDFIVVGIPPWCRRRRHFPCCGRCGCCGCCGWSRRCRRCGAWSGG